MKQNKESLRTAMDRRLSFLDELPSCRAAVQQRIAQEEEPEMKRKISLGLVIAMALVLVSVAAVAAGLLLSPRVTATQAADRALEEKYGITPEMQTFFGRTEKELEDGTTKVTYWGSGSYEYPLGTYTALVKDGKAEVTWSHDGEDTSGGYDSEVWGVDQLKTMLAESTYEKEQSAYMERAYAITKAHSSPVPDKAPMMDDFQEFFYQEEAEKKAVMEARKMDEKEMEEIGREFIISNYGLSEEQISRLDLDTTGAEETGSHYYGYMNGKPCYLVEYLLYMPYTTEMMDQGQSWPRTEKDGYYLVYVNVEDGTVERYLYDSALGGVG